ncbi:MAG: hypothetical protein QW304_03695 [Thermoproteota archaeon]
MKNRFMIAIFLIVSINPLTMFVSPQPAKSLTPYMQEAKRFEIDVREKNVTIAVIGPISEEFAITIENNGGISNIRVMQINYTTEGGAFIWDNAWQQIYGSNSTGRPIIEEKPDYVEATFFALYRVHPVAVVTKMIISKNGIILINMNVTAVEDANRILRIGWGFWGFPFSLFGGRYAEVCREGTVIRVELPAEYNSAFTSFYDTSRSTSWMDFSTISEGLTMINIAPSLTTGYGIGDNRGNTDPPPSPTFHAYFAFTEWQKSGMRKGEVRTGRIAIYIHGPGGYEENKDMINLILNVGKAEDDAINMLASSNDPSAKNLAHQALLYARSAYEKIFAGDIAGAKSLLEESLNLIKEIKDAESTTIIMKNIMLILIPLVIVVAVLLSTYFLRKSRK